MSDTDGETGRGYIHPGLVDDIMEVNIMEVRFDSKCNRKAFKGLRIFQTDKSGCSMNGWRESE